FHPITRFSRLSAPRLQVFKLTKADAIRALAAKIRETVCDRAVEAIHCASDHRSQSVLTRTGGPGQDHSVRKSIARQHLADRVNNVCVPMEIRKRHSLTIRVRKSCAR